MRDHYRVLGVEPTATFVEIKTAFRRKALFTHPDKNPDREAAGHEFAQCKEAFDVLGDNYLRAQYDFERKWAGVFGGGEDEDEQAQDEQADDVEEDSDSEGDDDLLDGDYPPRTAPANSVETEDVLLYVHLIRSHVLPYTNAPHGFFTVLRNFFGRICLCEPNTPQHPSLPEFGTPASSEEETERFYAAWGKFTTAREFRGAEELDASRAGSRKEKIAIGKANTQARKEAKKAYENILRELVSLVQARDPRVSPQPFASTSSSAQPEPSASASTSASTSGGPRPDHLSGARPRRPRPKRARPRPASSSHPPSTVQQKLRTFLTFLHLISPLLIPLLLILLSLYWLYRSPRTSPLPFTFLYALYTLGTSPLASSTPFYPFFIALEYTLYPSYWAAPAFLAAAWFLGGIELEWSVWGPVWVWLTMGWVGWVAPALVLAAWAARGRKIGEWMLDAGTLSGAGLLAWEVIKHVWRAGRWLWG